MDSACDLYAKGEKCIQWVRPQERNHLRERLRRRPQHNIKIYVVEWKDADWINLTQDRDN